MSGYQNYTNKTYLSKHYVREKHILTIIHKETKYPTFIFKDENGIEYYYETDYIIVNTKQGQVCEPTTKFGKWAMCSSIGDSICASFYIINKSDKNEIFDVRINKGKVH